METIVDKSIILIVTLTLYVFNTDNKYMIVPILITISISAILSYIENDRITLGIFITYLIGCFIKSDFIFFIPLICYDSVSIKIKGIWVLSFLPLVSTQPPFISNWLIASFTLIVFVLKRRTLSLKNLEKDYHKLRDTTKEISMVLEKQNKELLEKQDYEINLATLTERNRIARDIHDNVGHLLSRSILQIGALLAISKNEATKKSLVLIKNTLSEAMDSIRASVHNLHEESIDLQTEIQKLINSFSFCPIQFDYGVETNLENSIKHCFIAVIKEALSNIIKHSDATETLVILREHPAFYQLIVQDNGSIKNYNCENGIGLKNITDRVTAISGNVNISINQGFRIFISIPKNNSEKGLD